MSGLLSPDQLASLTLLSAIVSEPEKAKRIEEIVAAQKDAEAAVALARDEQEKARAVLLEAQAERRAAEAIRDEHAKKKADLGDWEKRLGIVNDALTDEKGKFNAVREKVDAEHKSRDQSLRDRENAVGAREVSISSREREVAAREESAKNLSERVIAVHRKMQDAVAGL